MGDEGRKKMARFTVVIPDEIAADLQSWADYEGRPRANLAAYLIELGVRSKYPDKYPPKISTELSDSPD